ncbi:MAG: proton-translocating NADH-quinone oxidoreductase, chain [Acidimicrobiia bacterium]|nr:proton-translocating NADH-quinone oxidoreductase, chain [Acidimicrobiia bacterium]
MLAQVPATPIDIPIDWFGLSPMLVLLGGALVLLVGSVLVAPLFRVRGMFAAATVAIAGAAIVLSFFNWYHVRHGGPKNMVAGAVALDGFSIFVTIAICSAVVLVALLADDYLRREQLNGVELYALLLLAAIGGIVMASANDLIVLFLGIETLSIAFYVMAGSHTRRIESQESAIKYFVLGGFASAFFLYGVALIYGATGTTNMVKIADMLNRNVLLENHLLLAGMALLLVGLGFKVASAPFHMWAPDVYQGAPTPVTAFMASAGKGAAFAALLRVFVVTFPTYADDWKPVLWVMAALTLIVGSLFAVVQTDVKRMMAYSSISHAGFILVGVQAASSQGTSAALFYVMAYTFMVAGTFGVITLVGRTGDGDHSLDAYRGLARQRPVLAFIFMLFLLAQAGVPLTSGFMAKFQVIAAAVDSRSYSLAIIAMVSSVIAAFVYLRLITTMYVADTDESSTRSRVRMPAGASMALVVTAAFTLVFGIFPSHLVDFANDAVPHLVALAK